jgi:hypothetical protein
LKDEGSFAGTIRGTTCNQNCNRYSTHVIHDYANDNLREQLATEWAVDK